MSGPSSCRDIINQFTRVCLIGHFKIKKEKRVWLICYRSDQSQTSGQPRRQGHELATVETGEHWRVAITSSRGAPAWRRGQAQEAGPWRPRLCSAAAAPAHRQPSCHRLRLPPAGHSPTTKRIPSSQRGQRMLGGSVAVADAWACKLQSREKKGGLAPGAVALAVSPQIIAT